MEMTLQEWAEFLNGRIYGNEVKRSECENLRDQGIVVVFGASDDLIEFEGAVYDEHCVYDTDTFYYYGKSFRCEDDINTLIEDGVDIEKDKLKYIKAIWDAAYTTPKGRVRIPWTYETNIPCEQFSITEEIDEKDELYCVGILFYKKDLEKNI